MINTFSVGYTIVPDTAILSSEFSTQLVPTSWQDQPLTVLGLSRSGSAVASYVAKRGGNVFLSEMLPATTDNAQARQSLEALGITVETGGHSDQCYTHASLVVTSPGIPPYGSLLEQLKQSQIPVISEVELAWIESQRFAQPPLWIGITGTNGKTTTTTLIGELIKQLKPSTPEAVEVCGNIGLPVLDALNERTEHVVAELSSFQLAYSPTLAPAISVFTNLTPDHINWHGSMAAYKAAKASLFLKETSHDRWVVLNADDETCFDIGQRTPANVAWFSRNQLPELNGAAGITIANDDNEKGHILWHAKGASQPEVLFNINNVKLRGAHNQENILAAVATAKLAGVSNEAIADVCLNFTGVAHRLEVVADIAIGDSTVTVINDSKATNVLAAVSAIEAFADDKPWVILGGRPKSDPLEPLVEALTKMAAGVVVYGEARETFIPELEKTGLPVISVENPNQAFMQSIEEIEKSNVSCKALLFTPACASFDQHRDFEARGDAFKATVQQYYRQSNGLG